MKEQIEKLERDVEQQPGGLQQYACDYARPQYNFEEHYDDKEKEKNDYGKTLTGPNLIVEPKPVKEITGKEKIDIVKERYQNPNAQVSGYGFKLSYYKRSASAAVIKTKNKDL